MAKGRADETGLSSWSTWDHTEEGTRRKVAKVMERKHCRTCSFTHNACGPAYCASISTFIGDFREIVLLAAFLGFPIGREQCYFLIAAIV